MSKPDIRVRFETYAHFGTCVPCNDVMKSLERKCSLKNMFIFSFMSLGVGIIWKITFLGWEHINFPILNC